MFNRVSTSLMKIGQITVSGAAVSCVFGLATGCGGKAESNGEQSSQLEQAQALSPSVTRKHEKWRKVMSKISLRKEGCFRVSHPSTTWEEIPCVTPPEVPYVPKGAHGAGGGGENVGNGNGDRSSQVTGTISWAEGSFPAANGVTSVTDNNGIANKFTLQLNSNRFNGAPPCSGGQFGCHGWQQFVYAPPRIGPGSAFI